MRIAWNIRFRIREHLRGSLWFIPLLGAFLGLVLAQVAVWLQNYANPPAGWHYSASTASGVLTTVIGAMIGLLGFVVTVSVLVVQQASGTLSPRYMRLWYRSRLQKYVLGTFAGTFAYAFALLRHIEGDSVPNLAVSLAGVFVGVSLVLLLVYLDRFIHHLRPVAVAATVSRAGDHAMERWAVLLREHRSDAQRGDPTGPNPSGPVMSVPIRRAGAIQAINAEALFAAALRHDCLILLNYGVGDFVPPGASVLEVYGTAPPDPERLRELIALGEERTIEQDPAYAVRILVDIAIKALSAAINDPTTAGQVMNYLEAHLQVVGATDLQDRYTLADDDDHARVVLPGRSWEEYLRLAVTEIRECGETSMQVCRRLRSLLEHLLDTVLPEHRPAVHEELAALDAAVERTYSDPPRRTMASTSDRQGMGGRRPSERTPGSEAGGSPAAPARG